MPRIVVSIGLNVGQSEPSEQLGTTLRDASLAFGAPVSVAMGRSVWQGVSERFVQIAVDCPVWIVELRAPRLALHLGQEAIAYIAPGEEHWTLVHRETTRAPEQGGTVADFPIITEV